MINYFRSYVAQRIFTVTILGLTIGLTGWWLGWGMMQWSALLHVFIFLGLLHYIIGFVYQVRSLRRQQNPRTWRWFWGLLLVSVVLHSIMWFTPYRAAYVFLVYFYFLFHGLTNEATLYEQQSSGIADRWFLTSSISFVLLTLVLGFTHPSFFYGADSVHVSMSITEATAYLESMVHLNSLMTTVYALVSTVLIVSLVVFLRRGQWWRVAAAMALFLLGTYLTFYSAEPPWYIYILFFFVSYHYITWSLHFFVRFYESNRARFWQLTREHVGLAVLLLVIPLIDSGIGTEWTRALFSQFLFIGATVAHVSVSLLNEAWVKRWLDIA